MIDTLRGPTATNAGEGGGPEPAQAGGPGAEGRGATVVAAEHERLALYGQRERRYLDKAAATARVSLGLSWLRAVLFMLAAAGIITGLRAAGAARLPMIVGGAVSGIAFFITVGIHARIEARQQWEQAMARLNAEQGARVRRAWDAVPRAAAPSDAGAPSTDRGPAIEPDHLYARDLDLFGRASLLELLGEPGTHTGRRTLAAWLLGPADLEAIRERQAAVAELAPRLDLRQRIAAHGRLVTTDEGALQRFEAWAEGPPWFSTRPWLVWLTRVIPAATITLAILQYTGQVAQPLWSLPLTLGLVLWAVLVRRVHHTFTIAFARHGAGRQDARLFAMVVGERFEAPMLRGLQRELMSEGAAADRQMLRHNRLMDLADLRRSSMMHLAINTLTLWDFHVLWALERWQAGAGRHVRSWFEAMGQVESLAALAGLRHDNPDWAFAEIAPDAESVEATGLAHPLLPRGVRVANDVHIGPAGHFLFVTGSNMSGKSTLLRAIGINTVLAQAGGPVCATAMRIPPLVVATSIRIEDSLEEGVSLFFAALRRLKTIVDASDHRPADGRLTLLYLLDEVLQGTNTTERQAAVRKVLRHLMGRRTLGVVTSHDLALADAQDLKDGSTAVHFAETVDETDVTPRLSFDYRLKPGIATSSNALVLMRLLGL